MSGEQVQNQGTSSRGRPVMIRDREWKDGKPGAERVRTGKFHSWGYHRLGGSPHSPFAMQSIAIIELDDGRVTTKKPDAITFIDK